MEGKIALEEHFSTQMNNSLWDAKGEESRNGVAYAQDVERRLIDTEACLREMDRSGILPRRMFDKWSDGRGIAIVQDAKPATRLSDNLGSPRENN